MKLNTDNHGDYRIHHGDAWNRLVRVEVEQHRILIILAIIGLATVGALAAMWAIGGIPVLRISFYQKTEYVQSDIRVLDAIYAGQSIEEIKRIVQADPSAINVTYLGGEHLIHRVTRKGRPDVLRLMIEKGISPDIRVDVDRGGFSAKHPLHIAVANDDIESVKVLLEFSQDVSSSAVGSGTPLELAERLGHEDIAEAIREEVKRRYRARWLEWQRGNEERNREK